MQSQADKVQPASAYEVPAIVKIQAQELFTGFKACTVTIAAVARTTDCLRSQRDHLSRLLRLLPFLPLLTVSPFGFSGVWFLGFCGLIGGSLDGFLPAACVMRVQDGSFVVNELKQSCDVI
jgi:hypothetical protein